MRKLLFLVAYFSTSVAATPVQPPRVHWSLKTLLSRTGEETTALLGERRQELALPSGHRCQVSEPIRTETPAAYVYTRVLTCSLAGSAETTGTSASCTVSRMHGVASIAESGKWFVFLGKEASTLNLTLRCGWLPER